MEGGITKGRRKPGVVMIVFTILIVFHGGGGAPVVQIYQTVHFQTVHLKFKVCCVKLKDEKVLN